MTAASDFSPASSPITQHRSPSPFWPTLLWLTIQFSLLLLGAWRIPLSARWPVPAEKLALHEMAIGQVLFAAMFLPILFRTFTSAVLTIVTAPLFLLLAAAVAARADTEGFVWCTIYVCFWLLACAIWSAAIRSPAGRMYLVASAVLLAAGGLAMAYLRREFAFPSQTFEWSRVSGAGPATGAIVILETGPKAGIAWAELGILLILGGLTWVGARFLAYRRSKRGFAPSHLPLNPTTLNDA